MHSFVLAPDVFGHSVSVGAIADVEVELRVRLSERIVELIVPDLKNIHARRPRDDRCNVQTKNERFHFDFLRRTVHLYAAFIPLEEEQ